MIKVEKKADGSYGGSVIRTDRFEPPVILSSASLGYSKTSVPNFSNSWKLGPTRVQSQAAVLPSS